MSTPPLRIIRGTDPDAVIARLEAENERLQDRLAFYEDTIFGDDLQFPGSWNLTRKERRLLCILLSRNVVSTGAAMTALYGDMVDDEPQTKIVDVLICHLRKKLDPYGITIRTQNRVGFYIDEPRRSELRLALKLLGPPWRYGPREFQAMRGRS